jgi:GNAT superfamily N-acetyltransferase
MERRNEPRFMNAEGTSVDVLVYRPSAELDAEVAEVCYLALRGSPGQRPVTPALVRAWLRPSGLTATTLAAYRDDGGRLLGVAAVRWPGTPESAGRLWGPFVHPDARGRGVGTALLHVLEELVAARPGVRVTTVAIAESRPAGWTLFERAGWHASGKATLLARTVRGQEDEHGRPGAAGVTVRTVRPREYLDPTIADLVAGVRPDRTYASARDTFTRWTSDERYRPDGLLLAESTAAGSGDGGAGLLLGAALVYPLQQHDSDEPAEARLTDLLVAAHLTPVVADQVRNALVSAVLAAAVRLGTAVVRAVVEDAEVTRALLAAGFEVGDQVRYYARTSTPADARPAANPIETRP